MNESLNLTDLLRFDYYDSAMEWEEGFEHHRKLNLTSTIVVFLSMIFGAALNIITIIVLIRRRLWRQHEGYLHLLAILIGNLVIVVVVYFPHWLWLLPSSIHVEAINDFTCKVWRFLVNVVYCSSWYACLLLLNIYMRSHMGRATGYRCWQIVVTKCCTVRGSLVMNAAMSSCFGIMNLWTLWAAQVTVFSDTAYCITWNHDHSTFEVWEIAQTCILWFVPICIVLPVTWSLALWSQRKRGSGFAFVSLQRDDPNIDTKEFGRLSLIIGVVVFVIQFQMVAIEMWSHTTYHYSMFTVYTVGQLVFTTQVVFVPVCCIVAVEQMRAELRSFFQSVCRSLNVCNRNNSLVNEINGILSLNSIRYPPPGTVIRD